MAVNKTFFWDLVSNPINQSTFALVWPPHSSSETSDGGENESDVTNCSVPLSQLPNPEILQEKLSRWGNSDAFVYFVWPTLIGFAVVGAIFNVIICATICCSVTFRRPVNYFIGNLAFASTIFVVSVILRSRADQVDLWNFSETVCVVLPILHRFPASLMAFSVTIISLDRSKVVRHPLTLQTKFRALRKILIIWLFAILVEIPRGLYHYYDPNATRKYKCLKKTLCDNVYIHIAYAVLYLFLVYITPVIVMIRELSKLHAHLQYLSFCKNQTKGAPNICRGIRLVKNAFTLTVIFIVFHLPIGLLYFPMAIPKQILHERITSYIPMYTDYLYVLAYLHGALYSVMIFITSNELREHLYRCLPLICYLC